MIFKEYVGQTEKLKAESVFLEHIKEHGFSTAESILPDKEGELFIQDREGFHYILKTYPEGRECNVKDMWECRQAMETLAKLHTVSRLEQDRENENSLHMEVEFEKHNREMKKVQRFLKERGQKTDFERYLLKSYDYFFPRALEITEEAAFFHNSFLTRPAIMCHGDYQYHNILLTDIQMHIINFEKCMTDHPVRDIYLFLRKIMEKSNWSQSMGEDLLEAYLTHYELEQEDLRQLYYRLSYPEKFWKIVNFYYNTRKSWIPMKNMEKLEKVIAQEQEKQGFLNAYRKKYGLF